ncbi:ESCRT-II complex component [Myriangium duriaei CBS 260.36]|uniref:Vacuolar protein-sorting-associated protein 25 n=1 Tax=Myriangium duriaei CBS 260.36 TaxID=1168546 RepID=A0A9P4JAI7_9PEZI|nr:ESCRT-II complex component [Myriangium duriaei CBS 260.36]
MEQATAAIPPSGTSNNTFAFPPHHSFPPFFTLQPNITTQARQLALWSSLIQSYCAHNRIFRLSLVEALEGPLFHNARVSRRLDLRSARRVVDWMSGPDGDRRAEWCTSTAKKSRDTEEGKNAAWIYWRRPEEWADLVYGWVDGTGQRGSVLTVYELREGEEAGRQEWTGMDEDMFRRCLDVLVKRGKAQIFGAEDGAGVKFF